MDQALLAYYAESGEVTDLSRHAEFVGWLTDDIRALNQVVQSLLIHDGWLSSYETPRRPEQLYDTQIAFAADLLDKALQLDPRSLAIPRAPGQRVICCCREFATLLCAVLRQKGVPARSRCGFATYLAWPGYYEDHWVCEYYHREQQRWVLVDPQIDPLQQSWLKMDINPLDVARDRFINAGEAWQLYRSGTVGGDRFGISCDPASVGLETLYGPWFARGQLLRDFAALNKVETVPYLVRVEQGLSWDGWRFVGASDAEITDQDLALLDEVAKVAAAGDSLDAITALYASHPALRVPAEILIR
jgi:hypothetical protein